MVIDDLTSYSSAVRVDASVARLLSDMILQWRIDRMLGLYMRNSIDRGWGEHHNIPSVRRSISALADLMLTVVCLYTSPAAKQRVRFDSPQCFTM